jgi:hypothetical protein
MIKYQQAYDDFMDLERLATGRSRDGSFWAALAPYWEEARNHYRTAYFEYFGHLPH